MTDSDAKECNHLNINVLPPPVERGKKHDFTYSRHLSKLLRRFVRLVVPSQEDISFSDRELLDDVMRYGSLKEIARLRHCSPSHVSVRLKDIFARLDEATARWESGSDPTSRIAMLERRLDEANRRNAELEQKVARLAEYNRILTVTHAQDAALIRDKHHRENPGRGKFNHL